MFLSLPSQLLTGYLLRKPRLAPGLFAFIEQLFHFLSFTPVLTTPCLLQCLFAYWERVVVLVSMWVLNVAFPW